MPVPKPLRSIWGSTIRTEGQLRAYVLRTSGLCVGLALACDVANQLVFFESWTVALRSWLLTMAISGSIAFVATRAHGRVNLGLYRAKKELERVSRTDPLTGLLNRRALLDGLDGALDTLTLVIVDIDRFKQVNDTFGHLAGDDVIRAVSRVMRERLGDLGAIGRLGGEEFACLSQQVPVHVLAEHLTRFRDAIAGTPVLVRGGAVTVTISAGIAVRRDQQSFEDLYAAADRALYAAKNAGRNRIVIDGDGPDGASAGEGGPRQPRAAA